MGRVTLLPGERMVCGVRPHWLLVGDTVIWAAPSLLVAGGLLLLASQAASPLAPAAIGAMLGLTAGVGLCVAAVTQQTTEYLLTDRRLVRRSVFSAAELALAKVDSVRVRRTGAEAMAGCGTVAVTAAGGRLKLRAVPNAESFAARLTAHTPAGRQPA